MKKVLLIKNSSELEIYMEIAKNKGHRLIKVYRALSSIEFPICVSSVEENGSSYIEMFESTSAKKPYSLKDLFDKKSVLKLIKEKDERTKIQREMKEALRNFSSIKGYELFQSAIDKNGYDIASLHFTIDFLLGNEEKGTKKLKRAFKLIKKI